MPKIFLSAGSEEYRTLSSCNPPYVLCSFWPLYRRGPKSTREILAHYGQDTKIMIDSGAHAFRQDRPEFSNTKFYDRYMERYYEFLEEHHKRIFSAVELDIGFRVGQNKIDLWNKLYLDPIEKKFNVPIVRVFHHEEHNMQDWVRMCKQFSYVGITGNENVAAGQQISLFNQFFSVAKKYKTKVHGFALTSFDTMKRYPFYTVDSTTWLMGQKYGSTFMFRGNRLIRFEKKARSRNFLKAFALRKGLDWNKIRDEVPSEVSRLNILAWLEAQKWLDSHSKHKEYWSPDYQLEETLEGIAKDILELPTEREKFNKDDFVIHTERRYDPKEFTPSEAQRLVLSKKALKKYLIQQHFDRTYNAKALVTELTAPPKRAEPPPQEQDDLTASIISSDRFTPPSTTNTNTNTNKELPKSESETTKVLFEE